MNRLRNLHLYLGCIFAPMLLFFAASGIWQMFGLQWKSNFLTTLSTIHTAHGMKTGANLSSPWLKFFVLLMAVAFILTIMLGVVMALRHTRSKKLVYGCLALGVLVPLLLVLLRLTGVL